MASCFTLDLEVDASVARVVRDASTALTEADLDATLDLLAARVIGQGRSVTVRATGRTSAVVELEPFAELTLREAAAIARSTGTQAKKARRIEEIVLLGGY